jgi:hypothetical protein
LFKCGLSLQVHKTLEATGKIQDKAFSNTTNKIQLYTIRLFLQNALPVSAAVTA